MESMRPPGYNHSDFVTTPCTWAHDVWLHIAATIEAKSLNKLSKERNISDYNW